MEFAARFCSESTDSSVLVCSGKGPVIVPWRQSLPMSGRITVDIYGIEKSG